eukprot:403367954
MLASANYSNYSPAKTSNLLNEGDEQMQKKIAAISKSDQKPTPQYLTKENLTTAYSSKFDYGNSERMNYNDVQAIRSKQSPLKRPKWEQPAKQEEAIKGIYNFNQEVGEIRTFLDLLHSKHEQDNTYEYPPGVPSYDQCLGKQEEIEEALDILQTRQTKASRKSPTKSASKAEAKKSFQERMEQDQFTRKLRDVFYEQWSNSKIMCVQGQYQHKHKH